MLFRSVSQSRYGTVTMVEKFVVGKDPKLTVLKFDRVQYEALLRAIRKLNP